LDAAQVIKISDGYW